MRSMHARKAITGASPGTSAIAGKVCRRYFCRDSLPSPVLTQ